MLDFYVLKGFGIYMIGILGSLSGAVGGFSCMSFTHHVISSCNMYRSVTVKLCIIYTEQLVRWMRQLRQRQKEKETLTQDLCILTRLHGEVT